MKPGVPVVRLVNMVVPGALHKEVALAVKSGTAGVKTYIYFGMVSEATQPIELVAFKVTLK